MLQNEQGNQDLEAGLHREAAETRTVVLKVWLPGQQPQRHVGVCYKCRTSGRDLLNQKPLEMGRAICVLTGLPGDLPTGDTWEHCAKEGGRVLGSQSRGLNPSP